MNKIGTEEQRKCRIGGSEFATVLDINPFKKRIYLILEKAGVIADEFKGNDATRRGNLLEEEVIKLFENKTGLKVKNQQEEFIYEPNYSLPLVCHVDGLTENAIFEAKTTDINSKVWDKGIPDYYKAQLEFNCYLSGYKKAYIAVAFCDDVEIKDFRYYEYIPIMRKEEIIMACTKFSQEVEHYKKMGVLNSGKIRKTEIDSQKIDILLNLKQQISLLKAQLTPLEKMKEAIEKQLIEKIGNDAGIENDLYKITLGNRITSPKNTYSITRSTLKVELKGE